MHPFWQPVIVLMNDNDSFTNKPGKTGIARIIDATFYSMKGLASTWRFEAAFRQEVFLTVVCLPFIPFLGNDLVHQLVLFFALMLILITELLNSAVEAVVDRVGAEHHELAGRAKDIGSAAVFVSLVTFFVIWGFSVYQFLQLR